MLSWMDLLPLVKEKAGVFSSSLSTASLRPNSMLGSCWLFCVLYTYVRMSPAAA